MYADIGMPASSCAGQWWEMLRCDAQTPALDRTTCARFVAAIVTAARATPTGGSQPRSGNWTVTDLGKLAPPKCSDAGSSTVLTGYLTRYQAWTVSVPQPTTRNPPPVTWARYCGPAVALVRLHGASYRVQGGRCLTGARGDSLDVGPARVHTSRTRQVVQLAGE